MSRGGVSGGRMGGDFGVFSTSGASVVSGISGVFGAVGAVLFGVMGFCLVSIGAVLGISYDVCAIQDYSLTFSTDTAELSAGLEALPDGKMEVLSHKLNLSTDNPNGAKVYVSSKDNKTTPTCVSGECMGGGAGGSTGGGSGTGITIQSATGTMSSPQALSTNTFGFAIPNNAMVNYVSNNFSDEGAYVMRKVDAKYAKLSSDYHLVYGVDNRATVYFHMYYGINANSLLDAGTYTMDVVYTVVAGTPTGNIPENNNDTLEVSPNVLKKIAGGETITASTNIKANVSLSNSDIDFKINGKACTDINITQNTIAEGGTGTGGGTGNELKNLIFTCKTPQNSAGKYNATLQVIKNNATISNITKINAVEYKESLLSKFTNMQEPGLHIACENTYIHDEATLRDTRDGNTYTIAKLKDGKCWMTQNLRLKLDKNKALTPQDTDISSNWTPTRNTEVSSGNGGDAGQGSGDRWDNDPEGDNTIRSIYRTPTYNTDGVYYTFSAATASSGYTLATDGQNVPYSICPKGWRLPTSSNVNGQGEFWQLADKYNVSATWKDNNRYLDGSHNLSQAPASFQLSGYYDYHGYPANIDSHGTWWSSTVGSSTYGRNLYLVFSSYYVYPHSYWYRYSGRSVRCVVR